MRRGWKECWYSHGEMVWPLYGIFTGNDTETENIKFSLLWLSEVVLWEWARPNPRHVHISSSHHSAQSLSQGRTLQFTWHWTVWNYVTSSKPFRNEIILCNLKVFCHNKKSIWIFYPYHFLVQIAYITDFLVPLIPVKLSILTLIIIQQHTFKLAH